MGSCHWRYGLQLLRTRGIAALLTPRHRRSEHDHIVIVDRIDEQPATLIPQRLLLIRGVPQFAGVGLRERPLHLMILLAPVQGLLYILPHLRRVHVPQEVDTPVDMFILPQGEQRAITPLRCTQLADQDTLRRRLACQRHKDAQDLVPLADDERGVEFAHWPEQRVGAIVFRMLKAIQGRAHLLLDLA